MALFGTDSPSALVFVGIVIVLTIFIFLIRQPIKLVSLEKTDVSIQVGLKVLTESKTKLQASEEKMKDLSAVWAKVKKLHDTMKADADRTLDQCNSLETDINLYIKQRTPLVIEMIEKHLYVKSLMAAMWARASEAGQKQEQELNNIVALRKAVMRNGNRINKVEPLVITPDEVKRWISHFDAVFMPMDKLTLEPLPWYRRRHGVIVPTAYFFVPENPNIFTVMDSYPGYSSWSAESSGGGGSSMPDTQKDTVSDPAQQDVAPADEKLVELLTYRHKVRSCFHVLRYDDYRTVEQCTELAKLIADFGMRRELVRRELVKQHLFLKTVLQDQWHHAVSVPRKESKMKAKQAALIEKSIWGENNQMVNIEPLCLSPDELKLCIHKFEESFFGVSQMMLVPKGAAQFAKSNNAAVQTVETTIAKFRDMEMRRLSNFFVPLAMRLPKYDEQHGSSGTKSGRMYNDTSTSSGHNDVTQNNSNMGSVFFLKAPLEADSATQFATYKQDKPMDGLTLGPTTVAVQTVETTINKVRDMERHTGSNHYFLPVTMAWSSSRSMPDPRRTTNAMNLLESQTELDDTSSTGSSSFYGGDSIAPPIQDES